MNLSTRIAVMREGAIEQVGAPREVYEAPANRFVAGFIGSVNLLECQADGSDLLSGTQGDIRVQVAAPVAASDGPSWVAIRPEKITLQREAPAPGTANAVRGRIEEITYLGAHSTFHVRTDGDRVVTVTVPMHSRTSERVFTWDESVWLTWSPDSVVVLPQ
jgi:putrescine transport system ATP-binding protein